MYNNESNYTLKIVGILKEKDDDINNLINSFLLIKNILDVLILWLENIS